MEPMSCLVLDVEQWAEMQFGTCQLGDVRRTRRAVKVAAQMASHPDGSTPDQIECWGDLKAAYKLFDQDDVTFEALAAPHWEHTRRRAQGTCLLINDTMETDFGIHRHVEGLGPTGDGYGRGFMLHSSLLVEADTREVVGLAQQELFYRCPRGRAKESSYRRTQRARESEVWGRVIDRVGPAPQDVKYLHVCDRGADNIEVFCHCRQQQCGWVIRATQLERIIETPRREQVKLSSWLAAQPVCGTYEMSLRSTAQEEARTARLEVRSAPVVLISPRRETAYLRQMGPQEITEWVVEAREVDPPAGVKPLQWVLHTSEAVHNLQDAWRILEYYETRWLIEEFHKCMKTGCRLESRLQKTARRLEAVAGMLSVLAVRLLQLKSIANKHPELPAERVVPHAWLLMLRSLRHRKILTIRDFVRHLAGLGGFLMRKNDGEPGWITLWRGLDKLLLCLRGARAMTKKCG
jgi:transposase-like protein/transposase Tn5 family protein